MIMFKRNKPFILLLLITVLFLAVLPAQADTGPKRSVSVQLTNLPAGTVYAAILPKTDEATLYPNYMNDLTVPREIADKFWGKAFDGYIFTGVIRDVTESGLVEYTNRALTGFKLLVYIPETDTVLLSEPCEAYAFQSSFEADLSGGTLKMIQTGTKIDGFLRFLARLAATVGIEIAVALLFGLRKKNHLIWIALANIITQVILNLVLKSLLLSGIWYILGYSLLELMIFAVEALIYNQVWEGDEHPGKRKIWTYSFAANLASFLVGLI